MKSLFLALTLLLPVSSVAQSLLVARQALAQQPSSQIYPVGFYRGGQCGTQLAFDVSDARSACALAKEYQPDALDFRLRCREKCEKILKTYPDLHCTMTDWGADKEEILIVTEEFIQKLME